VIPAGYEVHDLSLDHAGPLAEAYARNRMHLAPWEPRRPESFYTHDGQAEIVAAQVDAMAAGQSAAWVIVHGAEVVGRATLSHVVLSVFRSADLGYWVDQQHQGRGLATGAVDHVCEHALARGLHRVQAGTLLHNAASQRVLLRCGFEAFGVAPNYLFIDGSWRDHRLYQRILHDRPLSTGV